MDTTPLHDKGPTLCVFAKPPIPGQCKTRLAATVGASRASELAAAFLADTWDVRWPSKILATTDAAYDFGLGADRWAQGTGDLGARLESILRRAGGGVAIGADSPGFPPEALIRATEALRRGEAAIGRTTDGGFWLIGLPHVPAGLFADLPWSSPRTAEATVARLRGFGFEVGEVAQWFDIDEAADLEVFRGRVARHEAPRTWSVLDLG